MNKQTNSQNCKNTKDCKNAKDCKNSKTNKSDVKADNNRFQSNTTKGIGYEQDR